MTDQAIDYKALANELLGALPGIREKTVRASPATAQYGHGYGGIFSYTGLSRPVFNALILPKLGLQSRLPVRTSNETTPRYGIFTGVTAGSGAEPDSWPLSAKKYLELYRKLMETSSVKATVS